MNISFYTIDNLDLGYDPRGVTGYRLSNFLRLDDALTHYQDLSPTGRKALGLTDGTHVLPLVECCRLFSTDHEGEDVLASDFGCFPCGRTWRKQRRQSVPVSRNYGSAM